MASCNVYLAKLKLGRKSPFHSKIHGFTMHFIASEIMIIQCKKEMSEKGNTLGKTFGTRGGDTGWIHGGSNI